MCWRGWWSNSYSNKPPGVTPTPTPTLIPTPTPTPTFTLTVNLNGGAIGSEEGPIVITNIALGTTIADAFADFTATPTKAGEDFVEYVFDGTSNTVIGTEQITANVTIVAIYEPEVFTP